ncbi:hypothetical protein D3C84_782750 [compost metagenome]
MLPGLGQAIGTQADTGLMHKRRAVIATANVILPRPDGFHRRARGLGHLHRFADKVRGRIGPPAKPATEELGMDHYLLGFEPGDFCRDHLVQGLELGAGPDLALVRGNPDSAVERLHRRMSQIRHAVLGLDGFHRLTQR